MRIGHFLLGGLLMSDLMSWSSESNRLLVPMAEEATNGIQCGMSAMIA